MKLAASLLPLLLLSPSARADPSSVRAAPSRGEVVARALDSAVTVEGDGAYGAGLLVAPAAGLVLTALHVVAPMRAPRVVFLDGRSAPARVVDEDRALDLALLDVGAQALPAPIIGDATRLRPGDDLIAVGCPRHFGFTVTRGIASYVGRATAGVRWLQTDLAINEGSSGGPVVDERGAVVGVTSWVLRATEGLAFALPINYALARFPALAGLAPDGDYLPRFEKWRSMR